jgi:hypothetical protein
MSTFTQRISATGNDGYYAAEWFVDGGWIIVGKSYSGSEVYSGLRFTNVTIPAGSTINSAYLVLTAIQNDTATVASKIIGIDEDNTANLSSNPSGRTQTTAKIDWDFNNITLHTEYTSPDIKSIIQEIIDRAGWTSGNALGFTLRDDGSSNNNIVHFESRSSDATKAAYLEITYTIPGTVTSSSTSSSTSTSTSTSSSSSSSSSTSSSTTTRPAGIPGEIGIWVSKPGVDALTDTSPNDFYLDSRYPMLKVHAYGTFSNLSPGDVLTINHNLDYKPYVLVFSQRINYDYDTLTPSRSTEYYQHDWIQEGASAIWYGWTKIYKNKIEISVGQTDADVDPSTPHVSGFYYIFKDEV